MRRTALLAAGWVALAVAATATGVAGVAVIGRGLSGPTGESMSAKEIARELATGPSGGSSSPSVSPPPSTPSSRTGPSSSRPPSSRPSAQPGGAKLFESSGGTVIARCEGQTVVLVSWAPANGYRLREVDRTRGTEVEVSFDSKGHRVDIEVRCRAGEPVFSQS